MTTMEWVGVAVLNLIGTVIALKMVYWWGHSDGRHSVVQELADRTFPLATVGLDYPPRQVKYPHCP